MTLGKLGRAPNAPLDWFCRVVLRADAGSAPLLGLVAVFELCAASFIGSCNCVHALVRVSVWRGTGTTGCVPCK